METKVHNPSFTVSLRGYDREEVDEYLDSLAESLGQVDNAEEHNRRLQSHINRLNARIKDLEDRIGSETPRTGVVVGERIAILLREAEDTATETISRSEARAAEIIAAADVKTSEAEEIVRSATARAEAEARRIESAARAQAADVVAEAENRAAARTRQIEQWAEQVISHTRGEEARMLREQQEKRKAAVADLQGLTEQRHAAAQMLGDLREALGMALGLIAVEAEPAEAEAESEAEAGRMDAPETPAAEIDLTAADAGDNMPRAEFPEDDDDDTDGFEAKLEAWVSGGDSADDQRA